MPMTDEERLAFFQEPHYATLATINRDGSPQQTTVWYRFVDGKIEITTMADSVKAKNIRRDGRVSVSIVDGANPFRLVVVKGTAELSTENLDELRRGLALRYMGPERGTEFASRPPIGDRVKIVITPERYR